MDGEQYLAARKRLLGGQETSPIDKAPMLMMNSEAIFDNGTRYLQNQKGTDMVRGVMPLSRRSNAGIIAGGAARSSVTIAHRERRSYGSRPTRKTDR